MAIAIGVLYIAFAVAILWAAVRRREPGWGTGVVLALLLLTLPLWVMAMYWLMMKLV